MRKRLFSPIIILIILLVLSLAGCAGGGAAKSGAVTAVEDYYNAMVERDDEKLIQSTCADWEEQALLEFDSFQGVEIQLDGFSCAETGQEGGAAQVQCDGKIVASYGNEKMDFPLSERIHQVQNDGGDWRVCGY